MNKRLKILGARTHYLGTDGKERLSAVDWWRVDNPLTHLKKNTDWQIDFINKIIKPGIDEDAQWEEIGQNYDILFTSYIDTPKAYAYIRALCEKFGMKHVMDLDDNLFEVDAMNPVYMRYYPGSKDLQNASIIISDTDAMSVTTPHLKVLCDRLRAGKPTHVLPNYIDPNVYQYKPDLVPDNGEKIVIGYQGSSTHYSDLFNTGVMWAIRRVMLENPQVHFYIIGTPIQDVLDYLPKDRVEMVGGERDHRNWVKKWQTLPIDIGIAPLTNTSFNKGKSAIKHYEYALRHIPAVYSNVEPYRETVIENKTGFLAVDEIEFYEKLTWLVQNEKLRYMIGTQSAKHVLDKYTIQTHWKEYKDFIEEVVSEA